MTKSQHNLPDPAAVDQSRTLQIPANDSAMPKRPRRMASQADAAPTDTPAGATPRICAVPSKLHRIEALLCNPEGASIADLFAPTGWQAHSLRGVIAGALKKRALAITS